MSSTTTSTKTKTLKTVIPKQTSKINPLQYVNELDFNAMEGNNMTISISDKYSWIISKGHGIYVRYVLLDGHTHASYLFKNFDASVNISKRVLEYIKKPIHDCEKCGAPCHTSERSEGGAEVKRSEGGAEVKLSAPTKIVKPKDKKTAQSSQTTTSTTQASTTSHTSQASPRSVCPPCKKLQFFEVKDLSQDKCAICQDIIKPAKGTSLTFADIVFFSCCDNKQILHRKCFYGTRLKENNCKCNAEDDECCGSCDKTFLAKCPYHPSEYIAFDDNDDSLVSVGHHKYVKRCACGGEIDSDE